VTTHAASTSISPQEARVYPNTTKETKERIALIAKGKLDSKVASQFLNETFDAPDYLQAISGYSPQQQFIDGLYEAYNPSSFTDSILTQPHTASS
jgi:hypothetical protein